MYKIPFLTGTQYYSKYLKLNTIGQEYSVGVADISQLTEMMQTAFLSS
jgi:hypothetical protein